MKNQPIPAQKKPADPRGKSGISGAFCRTYGIHESIQKFLPDVYVPSENDSDRYSYVQGSTSGGAAVYENLFMYSFHSSDPCSRKLTNSFDLVRIHRFAELDKEAKPNTPRNKLPSYLEMCRIASKDESVAQELNREKAAKLEEAFKCVPSETEWMKQLALNPSTGKPERTIRNALTVLENDPSLKGKIVFDEFANRGLSSGSLPWDDREQKRDWTDVDDKGLRDYLEYHYSINSVSKIDDALGLCAHRHTINDVKEYLDSLEWDNQERVSTLLIDYLGAADTEYTRAVTRKSLTAAVARIMMPGIKYDWVLILVGPQGIGKSTVLKLLGKKWFSDSLTSFEGKDASEMIQGTWINELGELSTLTHSETNIAKQFLSRTEDIYREPFGKRTKRYPRRCIFFGTSNENEFLKDPTGERRFWPVTLKLRDPVKDVFTDLAGEVDQIWAEARTIWSGGESLHLSQNLEAEARNQQELYREGNAKEGIIREFIAQDIPVDWDSRTVEERRKYWNCELERDFADTMPRRRVCAAEIWCECFGAEIKYIKRRDSIEINRVLARIDGWRRYQGRFGIYNQQKGYERYA